MALHHQGDDRPETWARRASSAHSVVMVGLLAGFMNGPVAQKPGAPTVADRPADPALKFANALFNERRFELAAEEYERVLSASPGPGLKADAFYGLARARIFLRQYPEARKAFERFLEAAPNHPQAETARFRLGEAAYLSGDLNEASVQLRRYLENAPGHLHVQAAWTYLGDVRVSALDWAGAREAYEKALKDRDDGPLADRARLNLARVLSEQGDPDRALELLRLLSTRSEANVAERAALQVGLVQLKAGRFDEALATLTTLEQAQPARAVEIRIRRAEALMGLKRTAEAEAILKPLTATPANPPAVAAQAAYTLGELQSNEGRYEEALATWNQGIENGADSGLKPMLLFRSAEALDQLDRDREARTRFVELHDSYPRDPWADRALLRAARLALDARDYAGARASASQLAAQYPSSSLRANALLIEARAEQADGRHEAAIALYRSLLDEEKAISPEIRQTALYYLNQAYRAVGQEDRANETLAALARTPAANLAANARFTIGQERFEAKNYGGAIESLRAYLDEQPQGELAAHALALLTLAHHEQGEADPERAAFDQLARDWPESDELTRVRLRLGEAALQSGDNQEAIRLLQPAAERPASPLTARARSSLGWALLGADQAADAAVSFGGVIEADPKSELLPEASLMQAWSLQKAGDRERALALFEKTIENYPESRSERAAKLARARLLAQMGRSAEAAEALDAYLKETPESTPEPGAAKADLLRELALARLDAGQEDAALVVFRRLLQEHPATQHTAEARMELGEIAFRQGRLDDAATELEPLIGDTPPEGADPLILERALFRAGRIALDRGDPSRAVALFSRLIDGYPMGSLLDQARFWKAEALLKADDPRAAETEFAALASSSDIPAEADSWRDTARLRVIQSQLAQRKWADVLDQVERFLADRPTFPHKAELHFARGRALQSQSLPRFGDARTAYQAAIEDRPGSELAARAQFMRGETFLYEKNYREAVREFHQVELLYKSPVWQAAALLEAGKAYESLDLRSEAATSYAKLIDTFPDDTHAAEARTRLAALRDDAPTLREE